MSELLLCMTQDDITSPYTFKTTAVKVFSIEEALFHCFAYWKQSIDDFCSHELITWVNDVLKLSLIAEKLKDIARIETLSQRLYSFLTVIDFFNRSELHLLRNEVEQWEKSLEWEKLKERGDYFMNSGEPERAYEVYSSAIQYEENTALLNNAAIALMKSGRYRESPELLMRSVKNAGPEIRQTIMLHLAEALILAGQFGKAEHQIELIRSEYGDSADLHYLMGEIEYSSGNLAVASGYYLNAVEMSGEAEYVYRLSDAYAGMRLYEKAIETLDRIEKKDKSFLKKRADIFIMSNNIPAAIKCMEKAVVMDAGSVDVWTRLAMYHRLDYDLNRAESAITKALMLYPDNEPANLESARIKKAMGKIKEYQTILKKILTKMKNEFRAEC